MKGETLLHDWEDGHELRRDKWQYIVRHPSGCRNARRGNLRQQYAKTTYLTQEANMRRELKACGVSLPQEVREEPKISMVMFSPAAQGYQRLSQPGNHQTVSSNATKET